MDRRQILKSLLAVPCAIGGYFFFREYRKDDGVVRTINSRPFPAPCPLDFSDTPESFSFLAVGDTGLASQQRQQIVSKMQQDVGKRQADAIFLLGDNFYDRGVQSLADTQWQRDFEIPFSSEKFPQPFYVCLGNHDYFGNIGAQIEYGRTHSRWNLPAAYYSFEKNISQDCKIQFFVLDTTPIEEGDYSTRTQICWLNEKLKNSTADFKIVIGHHPLFSGGEHGPSRRNFRNLVGLFDKYEIDLYICGHDHDLQLHDTGRGWLHLISGAGSKLRSVTWLDTTLFAEAIGGFARVTVAQDKLGIEISSAEGLLFSHEQSVRNQQPI